MAQQQPQNPQQQEQQFAQQEQQFAPQLSEKQLRLYIKSFKDNRHRYSEEQLGSLRQHAQYYNMPFYEGEFDLWDSVKQAAGGLIEGFTTFNVVDEPDNEYEAIIRNISHLAGFAPGLMAAPLRGLGTMVRGVGMVNKARGLDRAASAVGGLQSIPLWGATKIQNAAKGIIKPITKSFPDARHESMSTATKFLFGDGAKHIADGAFHLGAASAISSVWDGVDEMMHSFLGGAVAGGVFRGIGNLIGKNVMGADGKPIYKYALPIPQGAPEKAEKYVRALAGSLFMGIPATQRGATTPEQIYEYLLGAYFGGKEAPWFKARASKRIKEMTEVAEESPEMRVEWDPMLLEGFSKEPKLVRDTTIQMAKESFGTPEYNSTMAMLFLKKEGLLDQIPENEIRTTGYEIYDKVRKQVSKAQKSGGKIISIALSDGELGVSSYWTRQLEAGGIPSLNYQQAGKSSKAKGETINLGERVLSRETEAVTTANNTIGHDLSKMDTFTWNNILRTAHQIRKSNGVFVVDRIERDSKGNAVLNMAGVTDAKSKWGVQIAIDQKKPIYVFDTASNTWHKFDYSPNIRKFVPLNGTPKLTTTPAVLGGKFINRAGKNAIKDVIKNTVGEELPKGKKTAKESDLPDRHPEVWRKLSQIHLERINLLKEKDTTKDVQRKKEIEDELKILDNQESQLLDLQQTQYIDEEGVIQDVDIGMANSQSTLTKKSELFATINLQDIWKKDDKPRSKLLEVSQFVENEIAKKVERGSTEIKSDEVIEAIEKQYQPISDNAKGEVRSWLRAMNLSEPIKFIRYDANTGKITFTSDTRPRAISGKNKLVKEPIKEIQEVYEEEVLLAGGNYKNKGLRDSYIVLDEISVPSEKGYTIEVPLDRAQKYFMYTQGMKEGEAEAQVNGIIRKIVDNMYEKNDMYPLGGVGDKSKIVFGKIHPKTNMRENVKESEIPKDADYYGSSGKDFKNNSGKGLTQDNNYVYRGFSGEPIIDKNGNLILRSRTDDMFERNFPGKGKGTSVTGDSKQAREYSLTRFNDRIREAELIERESMDFQSAEEIYETLGDYPSSVIKIHKKDFFDAAKGQEILKGADTGIEGALPEQRVVSQKDIIIPKGKWESYSMKVNEIRDGDAMMIREGEFLPAKPKSIESDMIIINRILSKHNKHHKDDMDMALGLWNRYSDNPKAFEKTFHSNIMYELSNNGYEFNKTNLEKLMNHHFIGNAVAYNKRSQIWNTPSMKADRLFIQQRIDDLTDEAIIDIKKPITESNLHRRVNPGFVVSFIKEPKDYFGNYLDALSTKLPEHIDGAILVRDDVVDVLNKDAGHPNSGQNKSFIIDRPNKLEHGGWEDAMGMGTLLGKYMIHKVGPKATAQMKAQGHHMLIMDSAAKQRGERKSGDYEVNAERWKSSEEINSQWLDWVATKAKLGQTTGDLSASKREFADITGYGLDQHGEFMPHKEKGGLKINAPNYILDPEAIRYSGSTIQNDHMLQKQIWVKQLFTNLHQFAKAPIDKNIIKDIKKEIIDKGFDGKEEANMMLDSYLYDLNPKKIDKVIENLEDIGTPQLIKALTTPGAERFSEKALQKMLKLVEKSIEEDFQDGTIDVNERNQALEELSDYQSPMERLMSNSAIVGNEAAKNGGTGYPLFLHSVVAPYKHAVLHNYFVKRVTRPKVDNSMVARMRPYDKWMQLEYPGLDKKDNQFMLDEKYRKTKIISTLPKKYRTLGQIWDAYSKGKLSAKEKEIAEDVFEAVVLRVPMDSISGAHKLNFVGFTGVDGHGVMLHSKAMRALGGADLDGDEAFVYFGGRTEDGRGSGMKKSWKDAIHANKNEFADKNGNMADNKNAPINHPEKPNPKGTTFKDVFTEKGDGRLKNSRTLYFSSAHRLEASKGAVEGRNQLGTTVSSGQVLKSSYNALMDTPNKTETFTIMQWDPKIKKHTKVVIRRTARDPGIWGDYQRSLNRAQVAFTSDPLDEAGLKDAAFFFNTMHDAYFKTEVLVGKNKWENVSAKKDERVSEWMDKDGSILKKGGLVGKFMDMNSAYFGKNWKAGRRHTMEEVNELGSAVISLMPQQENTILPMMVRKLHGLDWSDSILNRVGNKALEKEYADINDMVIEFDWLQDIMKRKSFDVPYNKIVENVTTKNLKDITIRRDTSGSLKETLAAVEGTPWWAILKNPKYKDLATNPKKRFDLLTDMVNTTEQYIMNDFMDMATLKNLKRILAKYPDLDHNRIGPIFRQVELFKSRFYLNKREQNQIDLKMYEGSAKETEQTEKDKFAKEYLKILKGEVQELEKELNIPEAERSATWDQATLDAKMGEYRQELKTNAEKELFDQFTLGTLRRGEIASLEKLIAKIPKGKWSPMIRDLKTQLIKEGSKTSFSRLGISSNIIPDSAIQNHLRALNDTFGKVWKAPNQKEIDAKLEETAKAAKEVSPETAETLIEDLTAAAMGKELGFKGIRKHPNEEISKADKEVIEELVTLLQKYPDTVKNGVNQMLAGILSEVTTEAKHLKDFTKQDFRIVRNFLREVEEGTFFQRLWRDKVPTLKKRYYWLFPETVAREQMKYDIEWLKKEGFFLSRDGIPKPGKILRPTYYIENLQNWIHKNINEATAEAEKIIVENGEDFINLAGLKESTQDGLFKIAVSQRELNVADWIRENSTNSNGLDNAWIGNYKDFNRKMEKEYNWKELRDKQMIITNDKGEKISANGFEIINGSKEKNLRGINEKLTERFDTLHKKIVGDKQAFSRYFKDWFGKEEDNQPYMDWRRFVRDMDDLYSKGKKIPMEIGIDGMRHIARSMMYDLANTPEKKQEIKDWVIRETNRMPPEMYWPHMYFNRKDAEKGLAKAFKHIMNDPRLSDKLDPKTGLSERQREANNLMMRHKVLTGDWEFQDMQDFDRVDQLEINKTLERVASKKGEKDEKIRWVESNQKFGSMFSRKGHVAGWAADMTVMNTYIKNLTGTYYRQLNQIMSRHIIEEAGKGMYKRMGSELSNKWQTYMKLYVQGAMGNPDVIPEAVYNDPGMKIKGTPFGWWADNRILDKVNNMRKRLGLENKSLPEELRKLDYNTIRHWSNLEAKFELASLLAHPKTAITNIFGGQMHTIESVGWKAWNNARDMNFLRKINPEWKTTEDVMQFVIEKGVMPEFLVHELGIGQDTVTKAKLQRFIGDLTHKITSDKEISKQEITTLGQKHGLGNAIVSNAALFMSIPERILRRDAFMAHYVRAWQRFGGAIKDHDHPFLIELANKGVKATQFLYNAPNRPMFARTALGKVMTRFMLFQWNSTRFRNDVYRKAKHYGFRPGTEGFERFKRTMQIDMFVIALANVFMYSLFDTGLPGPWNFLKDSAEWLYGDEEERDKSFFGMLPGKVAPLQMITPPIARFPISGISQWVRNDYDKFTDYHMYTMLPFGRFIRDVAQPGKGLIENPIRAIDKLTGLPYLKVAKLAGDSKEEEGGYKRPKPGFKF